MHMNTGGSKHVAIFEVIWIILVDGLVLFSSDVNISTPVVNHSTSDASVVIRLLLDEWGVLFARILSFSFYNYFKFMFFCLLEKCINQIEFIKKKLVPIKIMVKFSKTKVARISIFLSV